MSLYERDGLPAAVKAEMDRRGISFRTLAGEADVSPATAHRVVAGKPPDIETYLRLKAWLASRRD